MVSGGGYIRRWLAQLLKGMGHGWLTKYTADMIGAFFEAILAPSPARHHTDHQTTASRILSLGHDKS